ncbi:hypothetical protein NDU88_001231 [Pleurodeles waltl]|uniref:Uncharacterized protein n=1 Tax=Pleurodeles waltl TaxID=8319 RepID=A0AAV7VVT7_PLEWA|nr:hypothetical protein NDU88_001231 [Pleurodeles waltl]
MLDQASEVLPLDCVEVPAAVSGVTGPPDAGGIAGAGPLPMVCSCGERLCGLLCGGDALTGCWTVPCWGPVEKRVHAEGVARGRRLWVRSSTPSAEIVVRYALCSGFPPQFVSCLALELEVPLMGVI